MKAMKIQKAEVVRALTNMYAPGSDDDWVLGYFEDGRTRLVWSACQDWRYNLYQNEEILNLEELLDHHRNFFYWEIGEGVDMSDIEPESDEYAEIYENDFQVAADFIEMNLRKSIEIDGEAVLIEWI